MNNLIGKKKNHTATKKKEDEEDLIKEIVYFQTKMIQQRF